MAANDYGKAISSLTGNLIADWPKLAWVAEFLPGSLDLFVRHGPCVEVGRDWLVEAVWDGAFDHGNFDQTDLVFGSGIRLRDRKVIFVSSGTTLDRLWYVQSDRKWYVSNSLPGLLAVTGLSLLSDYTQYFEDIESLTGGLASYRRSIPAGGGSVRMVYFNNLVYDGENIVESSKPDTAGGFSSYEDYYAYMRNLAQRLGENLRHSSRKHAIQPLVTLSQGYDAPATAVIARYAGCRCSVTIEQSSSFWRGSDSGARIADYLGMKCLPCRRTAKQFPYEEAMWATIPRTGSFNWTLFDYPSSLCLLFTGPYGDKIWKRRRLQLQDPFEGTTLSHGGIGEFRLFQGVFHCPLPFCGMRHYRELQDISYSEQMKPWTLHNNYDRPIPRRMVEEAGVPRGSFATRKKNTSHESPFLWPYTPAAAASFRKYLAAEGIYAPPAFAIKPLRYLAKMDNLFYHNFTRRLLRTSPGPRRNLTLRANTVLFQWANAVLSRQYARSLSSGGGIAKDSNSRDDQESRHALA